MSTRLAVSTYLGTRYITDGRFFGLVCCTSNRYIFVFNVAANQRRRIHVRRARRMTPDEIETFNATPAAWDPTPEQIAARAAEVRNHWDDLTRYKRQQPRKLPIGEILNA